MKRFAAILIALSSVLARADGLKSLEDFVRSVKTARCAFTQVVTSPAHDGQVARSKTSSGSFEFARPERFRFVYLKPFAQTIVADGQTLWLYDQDLNQVTARKQSQALGSTAAALIASATDLRALQGAFTLQSAPAQGGLEWVLATPKAQDGSLVSVRLGFKDSALVQLEMQDSFGQLSTLRFSDFQPNVALDGAAFHFTPPAGADVLRQ